MSQVLVTVVDDSTITAELGASDVTVAQVDYQPIDVTVAEVGVQGATGATGATGAAGSIATFTFSTPAATWTVSHGLGRLVLVQLVDATGVQFEADVEFPDLNTAVVTHASPLAGSALIS